VKHYCRKKHIWLEMQLPPVLASLNCIRYKHKQPNRCLNNLLFWQNRHATFTQMMKSVLKV